MTAAKRAAPDPNRDDLRAIRMWRLRDRLMAAFAELEASSHPGIEALYASTYYMDQLTNASGEIDEDQLGIQEAVNAWLWHELVRLDPDVVARHLHESASAVRNQVWRESVIRELKRLVARPDFPPVGLSQALREAAHKAQFVKFGDRKLATFGWKLLHLMDLPPEVDASLRRLLKGGAVDG